jgi:ribose/xylose/arabinose/galactoside ABC-type transport system permease subunit
MAKQRTLEVPQTVSTVTLSVEGEAVVMPSTAMTFGSKIRGSLALPVLIVIVLFTLIGGTQNSYFLSGGTWVNILTAASFTSIVACFEGLVMISGGLDLSVGSTFLAGAMVSAELSARGHSTPVVVLATLCVGAGIGAINGVLANYVGIPPIIATLGTLFCVSAVVATLSGGLSIGPLPHRFTDIGSSTWGPIPSVVFWAIGVALIAHVMLRFTTFGIKIRAIGGNRIAAAGLGLNVRRISTIVYILCGVAAAFSGVLEASNLGAGSPTFGTDLELQVIAAVVIGGVSLYGAVGEISGMVLGSILLSLLTVGLLLLHFNPSMQDFAVGLVMVIAVSVDRLRRAVMFKVSSRDVQTSKRRFRAGSIK